MYFNNVVDIPATGDIESLYVTSFQQNSLFDTLTQTGTRIGTAERKVLFVFVYYLLVGVFFLMAATLNLRAADAKSMTTFEYFQCEANGHNNNCVYDPPHYPDIDLIMKILHGFLPAIILVFAVNVSEVKAVSKQAIKKLSKTFSTMSGNTKADASSS